MRITFTALGAAAIVAYALYGAMLIVDWAMVAASGMPLDATIDAMREADQPHSSAHGVIFACIGVLLALGWAFVVLFKRISMPAWLSIVCGATIIFFGAPAYFFASFPNLNSVGDTFFDWNVAAAFALEAPLYVVSAVAFFVALTAGIVTGVKAAKRQVRAAQ